MASAIEQGVASGSNDAHIVLRGVRYRDYVSLVSSPENAHLRMTYHNGTLEIMSPAPEHERASHRIAIFMSVLCSELDIDFEGLGSTTFRRGESGSKKGHGKEPDQCFYFANALKILGKTTIDLDLDPAPDLWLELDHRASFRGKLPVYAALGVPEVWRYRTASGRLQFVRRIDDGSGYATIDRSLSLPMLTPALVLEALAMGDGLLESAWTKVLRTWVRKTLAPETPPGA